MGEEKEREGKPIAFIFCFSSFFDAAENFFFIFSIRQWALPFQSTKGEMDSLVWMAWMTLAKTGAMGQTVIFLLLV